MNFRPRAAIAALFAVLSTSLAGQVVPDSGAMRILGGSRSLKCSFPWYASADWDGDQPQLKSATQKEFAFHIDGIDYRN